MAKREGTSVSVASLVRLSASTSAGWFPLQWQFLTRTWSVALVARRRVSIRHRGWWMLAFGALTQCHFQGDVWGLWPVGV